MNSEHLTTLDWAHPLVQKWFIKRFGEPTEPQIQGWSSINAGSPTLISAPTGSGKTLAAFLVCIDQLIRQAISGKLSDQIEVIYVSPLKALSNDIQKNLSEPLSEILNDSGFFQDIRIGVRTGDTTRSDRQKMLKHPPHILITTPESLYILLTAEKSRQCLTRVKTVIIDEIHAISSDKRGTHLSLTLERLHAISEKPFQRIGLSATQKPIEKIAEFLTGNRDKATIVNIGYVKPMDLAIELPDTILGPIATNEMWDEIYVTIGELAKQHRSTLVFVNTRRLAERVAHHLSEILGKEHVLAHHGSLSRKLRLLAETQLKTGKLKVLVATASLELGIDIGSVDLVCQIGSPRGIAIALQRIGRAGHWYGAISKGRIFATTRDELLECAALMHAIQKKDLDQCIFFDEPIDILTQQMIAAIATEDWFEDDLFAMVKKAYAYQHLSRDTFDTILEMLSEGIAASRGRYGVYVHRDRVNKKVYGRRGARMTAIMNGGAIPDNSLYTVINEPTGLMVGTLDEDFAIESNRGDIILLGTTSWKMLRIESKKGVVYVEDAKGVPPSVPFWRGEALGRTDELSKYVSIIRQTIVDRIKDNTAFLWLQNHCHLNAHGAKQLVDYLSEGLAVLKTVPTDTRIIAERFFDEGGGMQLVIHAPWGARINKAWGLALRKCFCRSFNFELQASATDNGINISLSEQHSFPLKDVFHFLHPNSLKKVLTEAVLQSPLFKTRFRWNAGRSLALLRFRQGKKIPPHIQRMLADDLLAALFPDAAACLDNLMGREITLPNHPIINETMKDVFHEALDLDGLMTRLQQIQNGIIECIAIDTPTPSAFAHEILNANPYAFLDDAPLEERRARAVQMRRVLPDAFVKEFGKLNIDAIHQVENQVWPDVRNANELHDALLSLIALPVHKIQANWQMYFDQLCAENRASIMEQSFWVATERLNTFQAIYKDKNEEALEKLIQGWMLYLGPTTNQALCELLCLHERDVQQALLKLESRGSILRGQFSQDFPLEWCERRLLARIHRLTIHQLRNKIAPVTLKDFTLWLDTWQHITPGTQLCGEDGLLEIITQLQGFEISAKSWEKEIFAKRVRDYASLMLDQLCLSGRVGFGRMSKVKIKRRVPPVSIAPITFFLRGEPRGFLKNTDEESEKLSSVAKNIIAYLKKHGASFYMDIVEGVHHLKGEVSGGLAELVSAGKITSDGFDNLRALIDVKRRLGKKGRRMSPSFGVGRWVLLQMENDQDYQKMIESACWILLKRYGIVFRDLLVREKNMPSWRELLITFRQLEARGEIRGGNFVKDVVGEQFGLPIAIDSLRAFY